MRYAWNFDAESARLPRVGARRPERRWRGSAAGTGRRLSNVDRFVANSTAVADRIARYYGRSAEVIHPPVDTDFFTPGGERGE